MKALEKSGGLVDFKENIIFEKCKDDEVGSSRLFKAKCKKKYGFEPSNDLYRKIVNYQIKTYGHSLAFEGKSIAKVSKYNLTMTKRKRELHGFNSTNAYRTQTLIERAEKRAKNVSK